MQRTNNIDRIINAYTEYFNQPGAVLTEGMINAGFLKKVAETVQTYQGYENSTVEKIEEALQNNKSYRNNVIEFLKTNNAYKPIVASFLEKNLKETLKTLYSLENNTELIGTSSDTKNAEDLKKQLNNAIPNKNYNSTTKIVSSTADHVVGSNLLTSLNSLFTYKNAIDTKGKEMNRQNRQQVQGAAVKRPLINAEALDRALKADYDNSTAKNQSYAKLNELTGLTVQSNDKLGTLIQDVFVKPLKTFYNQQTTDTVRENNKTRGDIKNYKKHWIKKAFSDRNKKKVDADKSYTPLLSILAETINKNISVQDSHVNATICQQFLTEVATKIIQKTPDASIVKAAKINEGLTKLLTSNEKTKETLNETNTGKEFLKKATKSQGQGRA